MSGSLSWACSFCSSSMNTGAWACGILACIFGILTIILSVLKEKGAMLVAWFNTLSKEERDLYDHASIAKDTRNQFFMWTCIMLTGMNLSILISSNMAIVAYVIWSIVFIKDIHLDTKEAFEKYRKKGCNSWTSLKFKAVAAFSLGS